MNNRATSPRIRVIFLLVTLGLAACVPTDVEEAATATMTPTATIAETAVSTASATATPTRLQSIPLPSPTVTQTTVPPSPTPTPVPTPTELPPLAASGPFQPSLSLDPAVFGSVTGLRILNDGGVMLTTTFGYALLRDGEWYTQPAGHAQILVGVDDGQRLWYFVEDDPSQIYAWDGGSDVLLADEGWQPVTNPVQMRGRGVLTDSGGGVWLAAENDMRRFDGARWTIFTLADLTMPSPPDADMSTLFTPKLIDSTGQIWVGECHWGGPGPFGGGGARWFDGSDWHGADSPVASGCTTTIEEDSQGRIWVGLDADLWRYDPATDSWEHFAPPLPPEGYRFGTINDIAIDTSGEPWPLYALCGGASCFIVDLRFHLDEGEWIPVGQETGSHLSPILLFDASGMPWLFTGFQVYRVVEDQLTPLADLVMDTAVVDNDGRIWIAGTDQTTDVWFFDPAGKTGATTAVCPPPHQNDLPAITADTPGQSIAETFAPQIRAYLNAGGWDWELALALQNLTLDIGGGTIWRALVDTPVTTDVTGDGTDERILALLFYESNQYFNGELFVFQCQDGTYEGGSIASIAGSVFGTHPDTVLLAVLDMNGNGRAEMVFTYVTVVGTHANFTREVRIMEWDGAQFVDLIQGDGNNPHAAESRNTPSPFGIMIRDADGDGLLELELTNGVGRGPDASESDQPIVDTWAWDGSAFVLTGSQPVTQP